VSLVDALLASRERWERSGCCEEQMGAETVVRVDGAAGGEREFLICSIATFGAGSVGADIHCSLDSLLDSGGRVARVCGSSGTLCERRWRMNIWGEGRARGPDVAIDNGVSPGRIQGPNVQIRRAKRVN
jgi:hypothetical protein